VADLYLYEEQRNTVLENTRRLVSRKPKDTTVNNLLLYGDRGTGKSATIKAAAAAFAGKGLKLIEVKSDKLATLPLLLELLGKRENIPFIIYIDDLSFEDMDSDYLALKALLEGGIEKRPANVAIYATSNRRHMVKEQAQREERRSFDSIQEELSLADRFGMTVFFTSPTQDEYLDIVLHIAKKYGIIGKESSTEAKDRLIKEALSWEKLYNGRSPRTAVQFINWMKNENNHRS
jgi:predicted AAA+ superfamily ATPase